MIKTNWKLSIKCERNDGETSWRDSGRFEITATDSRDALKQAREKGKNKADYINDFILVNEKTIGFHVEIA